MASFPAPGTRPSFLLRWWGERLWLEVACPWQAVHPGRLSCHACGPLRDRLQVAVADPEFQALVRGIDAGAPFLAPLLDWLYEHGIELPEGAPEALRERKEAPANG